MYTEIFEVKELTRVIIIVASYSVTGLYCDLFNKQ